MNALPLIRTQYRNLSIPGTVRAGSTTHGESLTDVENFLLPLSLSATSSLYVAGVADGLTVTATPQQKGVTVGPGVALDAVGHVIVLAAGGFAVIDPAANPSQIVNVPTVPVDASGVTVDTTGLTGDLLLTVTWAEVAGQDEPGSPPVLIHAPWFRLLTADIVHADAQQVILAGVSLDANARVTSLSVAERISAGLPASSVQIRRSQSSAGPPLSVGQIPAADLRSDADGGLTLNLTPPGAPLRVLAVDSAATTLSLLPAGGTVNVGTTSLHSAQDSGFQLGLTTAGGPVSVLGTDAAATTLSLLPAGGKVDIGLGGKPAQRVLHVEGTEVHSGGSGGGFSFADRSSGAFVDLPSSARERWVWYAFNGSARLWSGQDWLSVNPAVEGGGLDVPRRMRVRQGGDSSAGIWLFQTHEQQDRAFVGMATSSQVGFWGNTGAQWGLVMDTGTGNVGIGTQSTGAKLNVVTPGGTAISATGGPGFLASGVFGSGPIGVVGSGSVGMVANGTQTGMICTGPSGGLAASFGGDVRVSGTLFKPGGGFTIDHPLDPENRYLSHSFVESPEMLNVYRGTVITDKDGTATVLLPDYVGALNRGFSYQLTVVGEFARAAVASTIEDGAFTVRTDRPETTVCWLVLGERADPWAEANRISVEEDKPTGEQNLYLHPELYGHPEARSVLRGQYPDVFEAPDAGG